MEVGEALPSKKYLSRGARRENQARKRAFLWREEQKSWRTRERELEPELWDVARPGTRPYRPVGSSKDFPPLEGMFSTNAQQDYHLRAADGLVSPFHATPGP